MDPRNFKRQIRDWWARNPLTYGETHGSLKYASGKTGIQVGTREFFETVDESFYSWNAPLHSPEAPFAKLFPYQRYRDRSVLEIGCGLGTMSMNWAFPGAKVTAVDLNPTASGQTRRRFQVFGLDGTVCEADAHELPFACDAFDYVYSWGVLHHSPNLDTSIREMFRVLRPGGEFAIMLYRRRSFLYRYTIRTLEGFLHGENLFLNELELASRYTEAPLAEGNLYTWPVLDQEVRAIVDPLAENVSVRRFGTELDWQLQIMMPIPKVPHWFPISWRKALARRWGWSLWVTGQKKQP